MKKLVLFLLCGCILFSACTEGDFMKEKSEVRIQNVMAKIRRGESVKIAVLGGSITTGYNSNPIDKKSWAALTEEWFKNLAQKNGAQLTFMNEGVSGTDSAFAVARLEDHILKNNFDLVILEYAMNDQWLEPATRERTYEGVIRKIMNGSDTAILALFVNERKPPYSSTESVQKPICDYYHIPSVSWKTNLQNDLSLFENFFDGEETVHPNNIGHASIAKYVTGALQDIWDSLPSDKVIPKPVKKLPPALTDTGFENAVYYHSGNLKPVENTGWKEGSPVHPEWTQRGNPKQGWQTNEELSEISFKVKGSTIGVTYCESDQFRDAQAWVTMPDGSESDKVTLKCYSASRKGYYGWAYKELVSGEKIEEYIVHFVVPKRRATEKGKFANVTGILAAGD